LEGSWVERGRKSGNNKDKMTEGEREKMAVDSGIEEE